VLIRESPPRTHTSSQRAVAEVAMSHEVDGCVIAIGRPMAMEVIEKP
jgi:hypothetical protein